MYNNLNNNSTTINTEVVVIGSGPGGYTAAFRAADLGKKVILLEYHNNLGGVCLNVGCIPSKALLNVVHIIEEAEQLAAKGIVFNKPKVDIVKLRSWIVSKTINKLAMGIKSLAAQRKVKVITGIAKFMSAHSIKVTDRGGVIIAIINFAHAIIATGSMPISLPNTIADSDPRIMDSTKALEFPDLPKNLLIIGGGIIGMEMGTIYSALGCKVSLVELTNQLLPGADLDLVEVLSKRMQPKFTNILLNTRVTRIRSSKRDLAIDLSGEYVGRLNFDKVLCAIGRKPNSVNLGLEELGLAIDAKGFIVTDQNMRTNIPHIFAIGDVVGQPMLAHKAIPQGKIAAEVICCHRSCFDTKIIPNVAYTNPEVAWIGLTEEECKVQNIRYHKAVFPWSANGRSVASDRVDGFTKILFNQANKKIIGAGMVGDRCSELIGEMVIAIEMGATAEDLASMVHPHPTVSETIVQAAELFMGSSTDLLNNQ